MSSPTLAQQLIDVLTQPAKAARRGAGYQSLLSWAGMLGVLRLADVEDTGSYRAALARHLRAAVSCLTSRHP